MCYWLINFGNAWTPKYSILGNIGMIYHIPELIRACLELCAVDHFNTSLARHGIHDAASVMCSAMKKGSIKMGIVAYGKCNLLIGLPVSLNNSVYLSLDALDRQC